MDKKYSAVQDFLQDDRFVHWVASGRDELFWQHFLSENPALRPLADEARRLILLINEAESQDLPTLDKHKVWNRIQHLSQDTNESSTVLRPAWRKAWLWAASIAIAIGASWLFQYRPFNSTITYHELVTRAGGEYALVEKTNPGEAPIRITMEDGSVVTLNKNSRLSYPAHFEPDKRSVILTGEAFFEVAKDATRPFYIYSNEVVTKVLGTSFRIRAFDDSKEVVVQVRTGRVSVYSQQKTNVADPETSGVVLRPNQEAVYSRANENLSRNLVKVPLPLPGNLPDQPPVRYDEVSATKVLKDIEAMYGIPIVFNEELLDNCLITTVLGTEPLYDKLDLVCRIIGATYKNVDAQLVIEAKGCK